MTCKKRGWDRRTSKRRSRTRGWWVREGDLWGLPPPWVSTAVREIRRGRSESKSGQFVTLHLPEQSSYLTVLDLHLSGFRKPSSTLQLISKKPSPDHLSDKRGIFQGRHLLPPPHPAKSVVSLTQAASIEAAFSRSSSINSTEIWHKTRSGCGEDDEISGDSDSHIIRAPQVEALRHLVRKLPPYWGPYYPYWVEYWGSYKTFIEFFYGCSFTCLINLSSVQVKKGSNVS